MSGMKPSIYAAIDLGATSGRVIIASYDGNKIKQIDESRFLNEPVMVNGSVYWDILNLYKHIEKGLCQVKHKGKIKSIAVDTWGNDFALFDKRGYMLENPLHYRDDSSIGIPEKLYEIVPKKDVYAITGIQNMRLNGLYRLFAMAKTKRVSYRNAHHLLMIPDIITYFLTGEMMNEYTNASTTQMLDINTGDWAYGFLEALGINSALFQTPVLPCRIQHRIKNIDLGGEAVLSVIGTHDTASAVAAVPSMEKDFIYISSGTWSLVGTETEKAIVNHKTYSENFTNEGGIFGRNRILKNVMGMWLLEEVRREWNAIGEDVCYEKIIKEAKKAVPFSRIVDPDDSSFIKSGNMTQKINVFLQKTNQKSIESIGEITRCIFDSLAFKYRYVIETISEITGKPYKTIHVVGGGSKNEMLNQITADVCKRELIAGPSEATAIGNILTQAVACGELNGLIEIRDVSRDSSDIKRYYPENVLTAEENYFRFKETIMNYEFKRC